MKREGSFKTLQRDP
jgi:alkaline phosphatase D